MFILDNKNRLSGLLRLLGLSYSLKEDSNTLCRHTVDPDGLLGLLGILKLLGILADAMPSCCDDEEEEEDDPLGILRLLRDDDDDDDDDEKEEGSMGLDSLLWSRSLGSLGLL